MRTLQKFKLGTFEVTQPKLIISDPCYAPGTVHGASFPMPSPGIWEAEIGFFHEGKHDAAVAYPGRVPSALPTQKPVNCTGGTLQGWRRQRPSRCVRQAVLPCRC